MPFDRLAEEPRVYLDTRVSATPSTGATLTVGASENPQDAFDAAVPGDTIVLASGAPGHVYENNFQINPRTGGNAGEWITVVGGTVPSEGTRLTKAWRDAHPLAVLRTPNVLPALKTAASNAVTKWRFIGVEVDASPDVHGDNGGSGPQQGLVLLGDASSAQNSLSLVPSDIIFDRSFVHGHETLDSRKGIAFNCARAAFIDGLIDEIHSLFDCQTITCSNGPGPYKIYNSRLEASSEIIAFGGAPVWIPDMVAEDVEIRRNFLTKNLAWVGVWNFKNLIEFKFGRRVLIEGNVGEHVPAADQSHAIVIWNANNDTPSSNTEDVIVRFNSWRKVKSAYSLISRLNNNPGMLKARRISIHDNVTIGQNGPSSGVGTSRTFDISFDIQGLSIRHETAFGTDGSLFWGSGGGTLAKLDQHEVENNLTGGSNYAVSAEGQAAGKPSWDAIAGVGSVINRNALLQMSNWLNTIDNNFYPQTADELKLVGGATAAFSETATLSDMALAPDSPYKNQATDGKDIGADVAAVIAATDGVEEGTGTTPVLTSLVLTPSSASMIVGGAVNLTVSGLDQFSQPISIGSAVAHTSDGAVASVGLVDSTLTITGLLAGTSNITVTSGSITSNTVIATVTGGVTPPVGLASIVLGPNAVTGRANATAQIQIAAFDSTGAPMDLPTLTFHSTNSAVAVIDHASGSQLIVDLEEAGIASVWVSSGSVVSNRVSVLVNDPSGGKGHRPH